MDGAIWLCCCGGTAPGAGNTIAFNGHDGVRIDGGSRNSGLHNRIYANVNLGIELLNHGNNDQRPGVRSSSFHVVISLGFTAHALLAFVFLSWVSKVNRLCASAIKLT